jgi:hypothetical protein
MRTVPLTVAEIAVAAGVADSDCFTPCGRKVGHRVEIDLDALDAVAPEAGAWAQQYWDAARDLWDAWAGRRVTGDALAVRRSLVNVAQVDSKKTGRVDLRAELDALSSYGGFRSLLDALLGADFDLDRLHAAAQPWKSEIAVDGTKVTVTLWVTDGVAWPQALGGTGAPGEVARVFTLVAQHAAWRDRKVRRLAEVHIAAEELWPTV